MRWFERVRDSIAKYGIHEDDIYNMDEIGFLMGLIATNKVITASERRHRPKATYTARKSRMGYGHSRNQRSRLVHSTVRDLQRKIPPLSVV